MKITLLFPSLNVVYIFALMTFSSSSVYSSESVWLLFLEPAGTHEKTCMGTITLNVSNQFKSVVEKVDLTATEKRYSSVSRGSRFSMVFSSGSCLDHQFPSINLATIKKIKRRKIGHGVCKSVCSFEKHALKNLKYEDVKTTLFYIKKDHQWLIRGEKDMISVGLSDDTKGKTFPVFLDALVEEQKSRLQSKHRCVTAILSQEGVVSPITYQKIEASKISSPISAADKDELFLANLFSDIWRRNYFDPLLGTDCSWTINLFPGSQLCIQMIDDDGNSYWLVLYNIDGQTTASDSVPQERIGVVLSNWVNFGHGSKIAVFSPGRGGACY